MALTQMKILTVVLLMVFAGLFLKLIAETGFVFAAVFAIETAATIYALTNYYK